MAVFKFPGPTKKWRQPNLGDLFGEFWATRNIDLKTRKGQVITSRRMEATITEAQDAEMVRPTAFVRSAADGTDRWWVLTDTVLFKTAGTDPTAAPVQDAIASTPTNLDFQFSDLEDFEGDLVVTNTDDIHQLSGGTWDLDWWDLTLAQPNLVSGIYHPIKTIFNGLLCLGDDRYVHTVRKDDSGTFRVAYKRLIFPTEFRCVWIITSRDRAWFGCRNRFNGTGKTFEWDGFSENFNASYPVHDVNNLSGVIKDDIPYSVNGAGQILKFDGTGFREFARFPVANRGMMDDSGSVVINWDDALGVKAMVHANGMDLVNNEIHILLNAAINGTNSILMDEFTSGVWVVDEDGNCYHKYSLGQARRVDTQLDFGTETFSIPGFLKATYDLNEFICGARIFTDNNTTARDGIFAITPGPASNRSYLITPKIQSSNIEDLWKILWLKFRQLEDSDDRIIVKYRTSETTALFFRAAITWTSTTTFTTTNSNTSNVADGDEVEFATGIGAGAVVHVSGTPVNNAGTFTVTIDEVISGATGTGQCRFRRWTKVVTMSDTSINHLLVKPTISGTLAAQRKWIQFKVELRSDMDGGARGMLLEEMQLVSSPSKKADE